MPDKTSTSETDAVVDKSVDLNMVWPFNFKGSPDIFSATILCLLRYFAEDGLTR